MNFDDPEFFSQLADTSHENYPMIVRYLTHLAVCHTVILDKVDDKESYNASSPSELVATVFGEIDEGQFIGR